MSLDTYANLQAEIAGWARRSDINTATCITLAEANMNRRLRTSLQLVSQSYTIAAEFVDKPAKFRMARSLRLTSGTGAELRQVTPEQMATRKAIPTPFVAQPQEYAALGSQFEFWPVPDQAYGAKIEFQTGFVPLSNSNPSNWILADHPDAYLFGSLAAANLYAKNDERAATFLQTFVSALGEIQGALRTSYDRRLRADPGLMRRPRGCFNIISGD